MGEEKEQAERRSLASRILRHLTKPDDPSYTLPAKYLGVCLRAVNLATSHHIHANVHTPCGLNRTAGEVIIMFRLQEFVDWKKVKTGPSNTSEKKDRRGYAGQVQRRISRRVLPKGITGCW